MINSIAIILMLASTTRSSAGAPAKLVKLTPVPFTQVTITSSFWAPRQETNRRVSIPHSLEMLEKSGNIRNLERAARHERAGYEGPVFMDSDLYKALESASFSLATHPDPELDKRLDEIIAKIAAAQMPDGYLDTWYEVNAPDKRWTNLRDNHELYCAGHLIEGAVAHFSATKKRNFLQVAIKLADHIDRLFGDGPGKRAGYPGHPELELALVKLWRATGEQRYFNLAKFFIDHRGEKFFAKEHNTDPARYDGTYWQDNVPIREHKKIVGHAVRAAYLMSGVVDVAGQAGDESLLQMVDRVWKNTTQKNMYITGGIGPSASNEGFTTDYDLPNLTAYQETCASVALTMWNHRLNLLYGDAKYADLVERSLYNGILSGVSLDGSRFFYVNPLESKGGHHRQGWYGCACCPPNVTRTLAQLGGYAYATAPGAIYVNQFMQSSVKTTVNGQPAALKVTTEYPWEGVVLIQPEVAKPTEFEIRVRIPGWCGAPEIAVDGVNRKPQVENGYAVLKSNWHTGDVIHIFFPMPAERVQANPNVKDDAGCTAVQRGPVVYCLEQADQSVPVHEISLPAFTDLKEEHKKDLLGGVTVLKGTGEAAGGEVDWTGRLYAQAPEPRKVPITFVPYYAWDNRTAGEMRVWIPLTHPAPPGGGLERKATVSLSYTSGNCQPWGINDGIEPKSSGEQPAALCHWWPHKGSEEWVQYTFKKPVKLSGSKVYWFDDTGRGECRLPASWKLLYKDGEEWKPVQAEGEYGIGLDKWYEVHFKTVETTALRLVLKMKPNWAAGIHEWKVIAEDELSYEPLH